LHRDEGQMRQPFSGRDRTPPGMPVGPIIAPGTIAPNLPKGPREAQQRHLAACRLKRPQRSPFVCGQLLS